MIEPTAAEPWRYRLRIPALELSAFLHCNGLALRPFMAWLIGPRLLLAGIALGAVVGLLLGCFVAWLDMGLVVVLAANHPLFRGVSSGIWAVLLFLIPVFLTLLLMRWVRLAMARILMKRVHAASSNMHGEHDLLLSDDWLCWRNAVSATHVRWQIVTALSREGPLHIVQFAGLSYFWLPDSAFAHATERDAVLRFIRARIAASRPAAGE